MNRFLKPPDRVIHSLSSSEMDVYKYLKENIATIGKSNIIAISNATYCSPSTVFNVLKKLGYSGFKEFKFACQTYQKELDLVAPSDSIKEDVFEYIVGKESVIKTIEMQSFNDLEAVCLELINAKRILVIANEITRFVARDFAYRMQLCNLDIITSFDVKQYEALLKNKSYDYIIVFSKYGNTEKIISAIEKSERTINLLITSNNQSHLEQISNRVLIGRGNDMCSKSDVSGDIGSRLALHLISDMIVNTFVYLYINGGNNEED